MSLLPTVGKPGVEVAGWPRGKVHQQLHEVEMGVHVMPAAAAGQAGQDRRGSPAARVAHEQRVFAIEDHALHLPFANIIIHGYGAIGGEHGQRLPLAERVVHGVGHGMLR
jgi:hypothetical protein